MLYLSIDDLEMGFAVENEPTAAFEDVSRTVELSGDADVQVDLCEEQSVGRLQLSGAIRDRAEQIYIGASVRAFTLTKKYVPVEGCCRA
ncbi:hypothetical protein GCM10009000_057650 [Halobacterium noricense]|uniref:Uncharacterized protein n=1 Tax=Haladaptatus pallidirubidus TaxID=1008152 RepID=A0AAV3UK15_9EURY